MTLATKKTKEVLDKLFGKTHAETAKQLGVNATYVKEAIYPFGIHVTEFERGGGYTVEIGFQNYTRLIRFRLELYPSCCGTRLFHAFSVDEQRITQQQLDEIMNTFFAENRYDEEEGLEGFLGGSNRIEVMMVERRGLLPKGRDPLQEVEPIENPNINYKSLWNFFHKHAKRVRTRLEVNNNTGNVIHNMEVIL